MIPLNRPNVLVSAFACNPDMGSEPGLGFRYVRALARHCDLTVITEALQNRFALERRQATDPIAARVDFHYIPWPAATRDGKRRDSVNPVRYYALYKQWQMMALRRARSLLRAKHFDIAHHLTMTGYREPGFLWKLPLPYVWGPIGGYVMMPWRFIPTLGLRGMLASTIRNVCNWMQMRWSSRVRIAAKRADALFASTSVDREAIRRCYGLDAVLLGENGTEQCSCMATPRRDTASPLRLGWSGLHVPRKALPILLHALARLPDATRVELHILGDGPMRGSWEGLAERLGVKKMCRFHGWLPREVALRKLSSLDAFIVTSIQDAISAVLLEALMNGLPVVAHACCGFQDVLDRTCALLVPLKSPRASYSGFAAAIQKLHREKLLCSRLGAGALARAKELSWASRATVILAHYGRILGKDLPGHSPSIPICEMMAALNSHA